MATILQICQEAASLLATQAPQGLFDSNSQQEAIFLSIAKSTLNSLQRYGNWQELTKEGELRTQPSRLVYYIQDFCPDFYCLLNNTVYVKDHSEKVIGALSPEQYMRERYFSFSDIRPGISELYSLPAACNGLPAVLIYDVPAER